MTVVSRLSSRFPHTDLTFWFEFLQLRSRCFLQACLTVTLTSSHDETCPCDKSEIWSRFGQARFLPVTGQELARKTTVVSAVAMATGTRARCQSQLSSSAHQTSRGTRHVSCFSPNRSCMSWFRKVGGRRYIPFTSYSNVGEYTDDAVIRIGVSALIT